MEKSLVRENYWRRTSRLRRRRFGSFGKLPRTNLALGQKDVVTSTRRYRLGGAADEARTANIAESSVSKIGRSLMPSTSVFLAFFGLVVCLVGWLSESSVLCRGHWWTRIRA